VRVAEHEMYHREGDHLVLEMPIGFSQASLGAEIRVPTLEGPAMLTVPKGTQYGSTFKISGKGLPNLRTGRKGDLVVAVKVEIPKKLTKKQEDLLRQFAETEDAAVLPESQGFLKKVSDLLAGKK
jgi:molecular chaperone DnaJ